MSISITKGKTFGTTEIVTAAKLHQLVDGATVDASVPGPIGATTPSTGKFTTLEATGLITATGGQIKFPATAVPSADANTLDDYEEGSWTPVLTFATAGDQNIVMSTQNGRYTKIGNTVATWWKISTSTFTHTTASGRIRVTGFPFVASSGGGEELLGPAVIRYTKAGYTMTFWNVETGLTSAVAMVAGTGQNEDFLDTADLPSGTNQSVHGTVVYRT